MFSAHHNYYKKGYTLIELLITMSILTALAVFTINTFPAAQRRARDARRQSDIRQYDTSLKEYASKNQGFYPSRTTVSPLETGVNNICTTIGMTGCPPDPRCTAGGTCTTYYKYVSNSGTGSGNTNATSYILWARLEQDPLYWIVCANGKTGTSATQPTVSSGACPL